MGQGEVTASIYMRINSCMTLDKYVRRGYFVTWSRKQTIKIYSTEAQDSNPITSMQTVVTQHASKAAVLSVNPNNSKIPTDLQFASWCFNKQSFLITGHRHLFGDSRHPGIQSPLQLTLSIQMIDCIFKSMFKND